VLDPQGVGLLLKIPQGGSVVDIIEITAKAALGIIALAAGTQGWALLKTTVVERVLLILAGVLLVFPSLIEAFAERLTGRDIEYTVSVGVVIGVGVVAMQWWRRAAARR
jgi:TRAP-type uncharacterized transport system fused permease subunit